MDNAWSPEEERVLRKRQADGAETLTNRMRKATGKQWDEPETIRLFDALMDGPVKEVLEQSFIEVAMYGKVTLSFENGKLTMINKSQNIKPWVR